ncbi:MAG: hypothetical protein ACI88G_001398 [Woeseiaceae bacterium]|jgi:hypothetical protein
MDSYNALTDDSSQLRSANSAKFRASTGKIVLTQKIKILAGFTFAYLLVVALLALADAVLTRQVLELSSNAYEVNVRVDASSLSSILGASFKSVAIFTGLFFVSLALRLASEKQRKFFQIKTHRDEIFVSLPGAAAIWNLVLLLGALLNNGGMILFQFSWLQWVFRLIGVNSDSQQLAAFVFFPLVTMVILLVPTYLVFSKIVACAKHLTCHALFDSQRSA